VATVISLLPRRLEPVCGESDGALQRDLPEFQRLGASLLGISVDGEWCHAAFAARPQAAVPLLADSSPKGGRAAAFGVYRDEGAANERPS